MTKNTISRRNQDLSEYLRSTSISDTQDQSTSPTASPTGSKTASESAMLAQRLASDSSWAERYVPNTPSESVVTPAASSVSGERSVVGDAYVTPEEAPPTYELATSEHDVRSPSNSFTNNEHAREALPSFSQPQSHTSLSPFPESQPRRGLGDQQPLLPGKRYERHETSTSITGTFTLHDSLDLSTTSGSISISLDVKPGSNPAILKLKSKSGSIQVNDKQVSRIESHRRQALCGAQARGPKSPGPLSMLFGWGQRSSEATTPPAPSSDDPRKQAGQNMPQGLQGEDRYEEDSLARVVLATIETSSGSVNAQLILTPKSTTSIETGSGSINLRLTTASPSSASRQLSKLEQEDPRLFQERNNRDLTSTLTTLSGSGSQNIHINKGQMDDSDGSVVSSCHASHRSTGSASLNIHYPNQWTGLVHASNGGSGSTNVRGSGLEFDKRGNSEIYAWRGVTEPDISQAVEVRCDGSGSVTFTC